MPPTSVNLVQQRIQTEAGSGNVEDHLHDVRPDYGGHTPFIGIDEGEQHNDDDAGHFSGSEHDGNDDRNREYAYTLSQGTKDQKGSGGQFADARPKADIH